MYNVYRPWGHLERRFNTFDELTKWLHSEYDNDPSVPSYYLERVKDNNGMILCWGDIEVKNSNDEMTDYTSL